MPPNEKTRVSTRIVIVGLLVASGYLIFQRGGLLAWSGGVAAVLMGLKHMRRPSSNDLLISLGVTLLWIASWPLTWAYVRSGWESGEVVEIAIQTPGGTHTARVWVLDLDGEPSMYYESPPNVGHALLADAPMTLTRNGKVSSGCADAARVDDLPEEQVAAALSFMEEKYQEQSRATTVFYAVLGGERDRIGLLLKVKDCS